RMRHLRGFGSHRRRDSLLLASCPPGCFQEELCAMQIQDRPPDASASSTFAAADLASAEPLLEQHGLYRVGLAYGRMIHRLRWLVIALWIIAVGVSVPFASQLGSVLTGGGYSFSGSESVRVNDILSQKLNLPPATVLVVFQSDQLTVTDPAYAS